MARDSLDVLTGASFDALYETDIEPELKARDDDRRQAVQIFVLSIAAGVLLAAIEVLLRLDAPGLWAVTIILCGLAGWVRVRRVARAAKADVLGSLCKPLAVSYVAAGFEPPALATFRELHLLPPSDSDHFEDHFAGARQDRSFELCEARLVQGSGRSATTVFQGQLFKLAYRRPFDGVTVVLRDSGWLNGFERPPGLSKVGLEDPKFEAIFEVFGSDQVGARAILTPTFMEQLLALEAAYAGRHIRCAFVRGDVLVAVETSNRFEMGSMFSSLVDRARVEAVAGDLAAVFKLMDSFDAPGPVPVPAPAVMPSEPVARPAPRRRRRAAAG